MGAVWGNEVVNVEGRREEEEGRSSLLCSGLLCYSLAWLGGNERR